MPLSTRNWLWLVIGLSILSAAWTLFLAGNANEIWEEAHYRVSGAELAWGYPDTPPGAPLWAAWSADLFGEGRLGPRVLSWIISSLFPVSVWFLASAVTTHRRALMAAALAAITPVFVIGGAFAYPEAPLQTLSLAFLGFLVRAIRDDKLSWWLAAGVVCALGVAYYYRFWFVPFGVLVFLLAFAEGRALFSRPKAWIGGGVALLGLLPSLIHNVSDGFRPILFHSVGRQDWAFWPRAIGYPFEQAGLVTPVLFAFILIGGYLAWRRWRQSGETGAGLVLVTAGAVSIPYFLIAFFDRDYLPHWPILAWGFLLVFTPDAMAWALEKTRGGRWRIPGLIAAVLAPVLALSGTLIAGGLLMLWRNPEALAQADRQDWLVGGDFEDWSILRPVLDEAFAEAGPEAVLIGGDHITTARIQTAARLSVPVAVLDHPEDASRSFQAYRQMRGEGEDRLVEFANRPAVIVLREPSYLYREADNVALRARLCEALGAAELVEQIALQPGRIRVSVYSARVRQAGGNGIAPGQCALLPSAVLEQPVSGQSVSGIQPVYGAAAHRDGIAAVRILLDGEVVAVDTDLIDLPGYRFPQILDFDPSYPDVYWDVRVDFSQHSQGLHQLGLEIETGAGETITLPTRPIYVR